MNADSSARLRLARLLWNWQPHPTQRQWMMCDSPTKVAACGRRWGKTEAAALDAAAMALLQPGSIQMIVSPSYDQSRLVYSTVENLLLSCELTRPVTSAVRTPYPRLTVAGSVIMARTADEDGRSLRGHSADRVIVDEAAYVRENVISEVISPMLADRDGALVMISTPFGKNHFYRAFVRGQDRGQSEVRSFTFPSTANPHISARYIQKQKAELSPRQFAVEYEAQFADDASSVFAWTDIEAAVERAPQTRSPAAGCTVAGIDWARYSDYTALVALAVEEDAWRVTAIDRFNRTGWSEQVERAAQFLRSHRVSAVLTDATSIGDCLLEQIRTRLRAIGADCAVEGLVFTNSSKRELIDGLAIAFAHGRIALPQDEQLLRELQYFEYELTDAGSVKLNARHGAHDDTVIALALACRQAREMGLAGSYLSREGRRCAAVEW